METFLRKATRIRLHSSGVTSGQAKGQTLLVESSMSLRRFSSLSTAEGFSGAEIRRESARWVIELRQQITRDVAAACGLPRALTDSTASGQATRESWRTFVSTSVSGLARRIESQVLDQLGVEVAIDTAALGGVDVQARAAAFRRLTEGGLTAAEARVAVRI